MPINRVKSSEKAPPRGNTCQASPETNSPQESLDGLPPFWDGGSRWNGAWGRAERRKGRRAKTHLIYLGEGRLSLATKMSENYKKPLEIVEAMTTLNMARL